MRTISPAGLRRRISHDDAELAVLDVRSPLPRSRGHLARSCSLPLHDLEQRVAALVPRRTTPVVLASDPRLDAWAARLLRGLGWDDVTVLDGGVDAWAAAGERLHTGTGVRSKTLGEWVERELGTPGVDPATVASWRAAGEDVVVLDGRPRAEYLHHHVPGGLDTGGGVELGFRGLDAVPATTTKVVVNCAGRTRSIVGAQTLIDLGTGHEVYALRNGLPAWGWAGLEVAHGPGRSVPAPARQPPARRAWARGVLDALGVTRLAAPPPDDPARTTYLVDVRSPDEHAEGLVAGARGIQGGQLVQASDDHLAVLRAHVVLVDSPDLVRAANTARWLRFLHDGPVSVLVHDPALVGPGPTGPPAPSVPPVPTLAPGELRPDDLVLDLRGSGDHRDGHLPGSVLVRREDLPDAVSDAGSGAGRVVLVGGGGRTPPVARDLQAAPRGPHEAAWAAAELRATGVDARVLPWNPDLPHTDAEPEVWGGEVLDHVGPPPFGPARDAWYADYFAWEHSLLDAAVGDPDLDFDAVPPLPTPVRPDAATPERNHP